MTEKETYRQWAATQTDLPIFYQPWWLDAVCAGKDWDAMIVYDKRKNIIAAMPYLIRKRLCFRFILMPQETQLGGVWLAPKADARLVASTIAERIRDMRLNYYYQHYPLGSPIPNLLRRENFLVRERVTYRIEDTSDMDTIFRHLNKNKRRQLQHAERAGLTIDLTLTAEEFYRHHRRCLESMDKTISYTREFLLVLERKTHRLGQSQIIAIRTANGALAGAVYLVWDSRSMYYLIPFFDPKYKDLGTGAMLVIESIRLAQQKGLIFDFEGSMVPGIAAHYHQFGSDPSVYCSVEYSRGWLFRIALRLQQWWVHRHHHI